MSKWAFGCDRLGQAKNAGLSEEETAYLKNTTKLVVINATDAPGADTGNGHAYFRQSPYTSSDILAMLMFDFKPAQRGLEPIDGQPIWTFPGDYIDRLRKAIGNAK